MQADDGQEAIGWLFHGKMLYLVAPRGLGDRCPICIGHGKRGGQSKLLMCLSKPLMSKKNSIHVSTS